MMMMMTYVSNGGWSPASYTTTTSSASPWLERMVGRLHRGYDTQGGGTYMDLFSQLLQRLLQGNTGSHNGFYPTSRSFGDTYFGQSFPFNTQPFRYATETANYPNRLHLEHDNVKFPDWVSQGGAYDVNRTQGHVDDAVLKQWGYKNLNQVDLDGTVARATQSGAGNNNTAHVQGTTHQLKQTGLANNDYYRSDRIKHAEQTGLLNNHFTQAKTIDTLGQKGVGNRNKALANEVGTAYQGGAFNQDKLRAHKVDTLLQDGVKNDISTKAGTVKLLHETAKGSRIQNDFGRLDEALLEGKHNDIKLRAKSAGDVVVNEKGSRVDAKLGRVDRVKLAGEGNDGTLVVGRTPKHGKTPEIYVDGHDNRYDITSKGKTNLNVAGNYNTVDAKLETRNGEKSIVNFDKSRDVLAKVTDGNGNTKFVVHKDAKLLEARIDGGGHGRDHDTLALAGNEKLWKVTDDRDGYKKYVSASGQVVYAKDIERVTYGDPATTAKR
jgi:hypothetical protein